jgi:hypothetical protein
LQRSARIEGQGTLRGQHKNTAVRPFDNSADGTARNLDED